MSLMSFARKKKSAAAAEAPVCQHWDLAPRWGSAEDMGKADRVTHYTCCTCGLDISNEEARSSS